MKWIILILLLFPFYSNASFSTKNITEGFTKFLMVRANQNALYTFEKTLMNNSELECLLPNTFKAVQILSSTSIFSSQLSNKDMWKSNIQNDLELLPYKLAVYAKDRDNTAFCETSDLYEKLVAEIKLGKKNNDMNKRMLKFVEDNFFEPAKKVVKETQDKSIQQAETDLIITKQDKFKVSISEFSTTLATKFEDSKKAANQDGKKLTTTLVSIVAQLSEIKELNKILESPEFTRTIRFITFFTELADAENPQSVQNILTTYTMEPVSYYSKREGGWHLMITSYVGTNLTFETTQSNENNSSRFNVYAPVGLELSNGWFNMKYIDSVSLMVAPLDFGYPISLKMNGVEQDIELDELFAPSFTLSAGWKGLPVTYGVGYQMGANVVGTERKEEKAFLFIAFDMPLWEIF
jgi:hypothetical protein